MRGGLAFNATDAGVVADFAFDTRWDRYHGLAHAGAVALALEEAMEHCLKAQGHEALLAEMTTRLRYPVVVRRPARLSARLAASADGTFDVDATLEQAGRVMAQANARFVDTGTLAINSADWPFFRLS